MTKHILVYGTLRRGAGANAVMQQYAEHKKTLTINGQLYHLGGFPGFKHGNGQVVCDLYSFTDPTLLTHLDRYEGYNKENPSNSLYIRETVTFNDEGDEAYIYVFNGHVRENHLIEDGDWLSG